MSRPATTTMMKMAGRLTTPPSSGPCDQRQRAGRRPGLASNRRHSRTSRPRPRSPPANIRGSGSSRRTRRAARRARHRCRYRRCPRPGSSSPSRHRPARRAAQIRPAMAKDRITAGPALAAPTPVRVRMPVPTIAPTPSAIRCGQPSERFSRCSGARSSSLTIAFRTFQFATTPLLYGFCRTLGRFRGAGQAGKWG